MTEEEIKKFAKEYVQNNTDESVNSFIGEQLQKAFIEGTDFMYYSNNEELKKELTEKDKQIAELKAQIEKMRSALIEVMCQSVNTTSEIYKKNTEQIEKMKCCENCKHHCFWGDELKCMVLSYEEELKCMKTKEHWEIKEND